MKRQFSLLIAIALVTLTASAQLLWKVSGNNLGRPSYIMGTYHFAPSTMMDKIPGMQRALEGCDIVVGEIAQESLAEPESQLKMAQALMAHPDSTLDKLYTREEYRIIETVFNKYFGSMGVKLSQMNSVKPMAIITQMQAMQALKYFPNYDPAELIDMAVQKRGLEMGRPSQGLETIEDQVDLLFNTPISEQATSLLELCKTDDKFLMLSSALVEAYMEQDLDKIYAVMTNPEIGGDDPEAYEALLFDRNRLWVERLVKMMPERACLVCVGAGHLPGNQGLLQLLRDRGYTIEAMQ